MRHGFPYAAPGQRIGLLGGSFDPAHIGHVHITREALRRFGLDRVWWLVTPGNPLKTHGPAPLDERLRKARDIMCHPRVEITDLETRLGTRLTIDTIRALRHHYPHVRFVWLMGADNLAQFHKWESWQEIAALVPIGVLARPGARMRARLSPAARYLARYRLPESESQGLAISRPPVWTMVNVPMKSISSTAIRAGKASGTE